MFDATKYKLICVDCFKRHKHFEDFFDLQDLSAVLPTEKPMLCSVCKEWKPVIEDVSIIGLKDPEDFKTRSDEWIKIDRTSSWADDFDKIREE